MEELAQDQVDNEASVHNHANGPKQHRVSKACVSCRQAHVSCDRNRPCKRCVEKGFAELCFDGNARKRGRKPVLPDDDPRAHRRKRYAMKKELEKATLSQSTTTNNIPTKENAIPPLLPISQPITTTSITLPTSNAVITTDGQMCPVDVSKVARTLEAIDNNKAKLPFLMAELEPKEDVVVKEKIVIPQDIFEFLYGSPFVALADRSPPNISTPSHSDTDFNSNETPYKFTRSDFLQRLMELLKAKAFDEYELRDWLSTVSDHLEKFRHVQENITKEQALAIVQEFRMQLELFKTIFSNIGTPTFIWERASIIHYANEGFHSLTMFPFKLPTHLFDLALPNCFSPLTNRTYAKIMRSVYFNLEMNSFMFGAGIRNWRNKEREEYIEGTLCITIKRDMFGLPLIFVGSFLPQMEDSEPQSKISG